jgi:hypothetical protein
MHRSVARNGRYFKFTLNTFSKLIVFDFDTQQQHGTCPICRKLLSEEAPDTEEGEQASAARVASSNVAAQPTTESSSSSQPRQAPDATESATEQRPLQQYSDFELEDLD